MSSEFGKILKVSIFGQSHGKAIGVLMDGRPAGEAADEAELQITGRHDPCIAHRAVPAAGAAAACVILDILLEEHYYEA